jgi:hypothetical protein
MLQLRRSFTLLRRQYMRPLRKWSTLLLRRCIALRPPCIALRRCLWGALTTRAMEVITGAATVVIGVMSRTVDIIADNFPRFAGGKL